MRIVFCGSGLVGVPSLRAILAAGHDVARIITQPARPAGRGGKLRPTPIADFAREANLPFEEVADVNADDVVASVADDAPDVIVVADFGQMVRSAIRVCARIDTFNLHASLLPKLRGAAPIQWAIIRGYRTTGVTTFSLTDRMDAGNLYLQKDTEIRTDEAVGELRDRLAAIGADAVTETLDLLASGDARPQPQDDALATRAPMLKKSDGHIDWTRDAESIRNLIHGTWPWPGGQAVFHRADGRDVAVTIARARAHTDAPALDTPRRASRDESRSNSAASSRAACQGPAEKPGSLGDDLRISTGKGRLEVLQIRPAGKSLMNWRDFVNGYRVAAGDVMTSPQT